MSLPRNALETWQAAERALQAQQVDEARRCYEALVDDEAFAVLAHLRLSLLATRNKRLRDAIEHALAAFARRPADADVLEMLAKQLSTLGEVEAMRRCATDPAILRSADPRIMANLGKVLTNAYLPDDALPLLERARDLGLDAPLLHFLIGLDRMYAGDDAAAEAAFEACLARAPDDAEALRGVTRLRRGPSGSDARIARLQGAIARKAADTHASAILHYALFSELDRRDRIDEAWPVLATAMRLRRSEIAYDPRQDEALFEHLQSAPLPAQAEDRFEGPRPIFIVGQPRTGTTLLERILGRHPDVADAGELHDVVRQLRWCCDLWGPPTFDLALARAASTASMSDFGRQYLAHTQWRARDRVVFTDKLPSNFLALGFIARALPHARILHLVRDPMDTCFSNLKEWFAGAYPHSYDQVEMADHYRRYRGLMDHWHAQLPGRILDVHYRDLVTDPDATGRAVLEFCGLPPQEGLASIADARGTVATASAMQVREPIHTRFLDQWKRYDRFLVPLQECLAAS